MAAVAERAVIPSLHSALAELAALALCGLFTPAQLASSHQQIQEIYKWNFTFVFKTVSLLSIQFLVTISAKHFLM
jgi:hypothetical protein